jgi:hypothetical protein
MARARRTWRRTTGRRFLILATAAVGVFLAFGLPSALGQQASGGAAKGCDSPVLVGQSMVCNYGFRNLDDTGDTYHLTSMVDVVQTSGGAVSSGNMIGSLALTPGSSSTGQATTCDGTFAGGKYTGSTFCDVSGANDGSGHGGRVTSDNFSYYTVVAADFNLPSHQLSDTLTDSFKDKCDVSGTGGGSSCDPNTVFQATIGRTVTVEQYTPSITTELSTSTVGVNGSVNDTAQIGFSAAGFNNPPAPPSFKGTVEYKLYTDNTCQTPSANPAFDDTVNVPDNGQVPDSSSLSVPAVGHFWFQATYTPDAADGFDGPVKSDCTSEPLTVVDANIQITPNGVNRVGATHTFTGHVNVNDGSGGFVDAPAGTKISFTIDSGPGAFSSANPCTVVTGGSCTVDLTSAVTGVTTVSAHTDVTVEGVSLHRDTDGTGANSGPATKTWVNAKISIAPNATNEVGHPHTFTVTLQKDPGTGTFVPAPGEHVDVTLTDNNGASHTAPTGTCTNAGANTDAAGQCTISFTSPTAGTVTGHATSTLAVAGSAPFTVATDGVAPNSGDAVKTFVDANIQITPNGVNRVNATHTFTGHVNVNDGTGSTNAPDDTTISFTIDSGPGHFVGSDSCTTSGGTGSCTVDLSSAVTGVTTVSAHTTLSVGGVSLTRNTDGTGANSGPAQKTWVNARISIAPNATNEVGQPHTFTVTLEKDAGDGSGFVAADGEHVDVTLTDAGGANHTAPTGTCTNAGANTNAAGQCTITFTSNSAGTVTGHATSTLSVAGSAPFTVATDGVAPNGPDAVKTFVDANIQISPNGVNRVGATHTFTAHVNVNDGSGFAPAPDGTVISFTKDSGPGTLSNSNPCTTAGGTGSCTVDLTSALTGVTTVSAHTTLSVGGVSLTRSTDGVGANSGPAEKTWVNAKISIAPNATNEVGQPHTFTVTLEKDAGDGNGFVAASGEHVDVTLTDAGGANHTAPTGTCTNAGANTDANGQCTITFTSPTAGTVTGHASWTGALGTPSAFTVETDGVAPNGPNAVKTFVDANIQITPAEATNGIGTNHTLTAHVNVNDGSGGGFVNAPNGTVIHFTLGNDATASAVFVGSSFCTTGGGTGSCSVQITSATPGTTTINADTVVSVGGVSLTRATDDSHSGDVGPAIKHWATAKISIAPNATNEVGQPHTFTVTLMKDTGDGTGFHAAAGEHVDVTLTNAGGAAHTTPTGTCTNAGANTDSNGQCTITFTSASTGTVTGHATSTLSVNGSAPFTVATDGVSPNSGDAVKTFVNANIQITPASATNPVGTTHVLTITVNALGGTLDAGSHTATASIVSGPGSFVGSPTCSYTGGAATASCHVTITSSVVGTTVVSATSDIPVGGVTITRTTNTAVNTAAGGSGNADKTWIKVTAAAKISIAPDKTNEVGQSHTFTVTLMKDAGSGFAAAAGEHVNVTLTDSNGAGHTAPTGTCTNAGANTDSNGQCTITFSSPTAGKVTGHASSTLTVNGITLSVATDGTGSNSGNAVKTYVDAYITITPPTATNPVGTTHTFTAHVSVNDGSGAGYVVAPNGTPCTFAFVGTHVGTFTAGQTSATSAGDCPITITSSKAGTDTMQASATVTVGGVTMTRTTGTAAPGHANGGNAKKTWQAPFVPPVICSTIVPSPKLLYVGRNATLTLHVKQKGKAAKGVRVRLKGAGINMTTKPSNAKGIVTVHLHPKKAGIVRFTALLPQQVCTPARIGITGVFTPPVTG